MATLVARGEEIGFTIIPYENLDVPVEEALKANPSDDVLGFITTDSKTMERKFTYTESGVNIESTTHWTIPLMKEFPMIEQDKTWIVYTCDPEHAACEFSDLLTVGQIMHIYNWDIWRVNEKKGTIAVVTEYEWY